MNKTKPENCEKSNITLCYKNITNAKIVLIFKNYLIKNGLLISYLYLLIMTNIIFSSGGGYHFTTFPYKEKIKILLKVEPYAQIKERV